MTFDKLFKLIGEDSTREGLKDTSTRVEKFYKDFFTGYDKDPVALFEKNYNDTNSYDEAIIIRDIQVQSFCEHHLLPMHGIAHIAYIPDGKIVGTSKIAEVIEVYAHRLQMQERMTQQIGDALNAGLKPKAVAVVLELEHFCMILQKANLQNSKLKTAFYSGKYKSDLSLRKMLNF